MAEVIGAIAGVSQLLGTALKLKKLCAEICNAPVDLQNVLDEVTILADLLCDIQQSTHGQPADNQQRLQKCFVLLQTSTNTMKQLTADLGDILDSHKRTGAVRLYLRKDELERCRQRLERVKTTMMLAQQQYTHIMLTQQVLRKIHTIATTQQHVLQEMHAVTTAQQSVISSTPTSVVQATPAGYSHSNQGAATVHRSPETDQSLAWCRVPKQTSQYSIHLPRWILARGLQLLLNRSNNSWGVTFRVYNRVSSGSEIIEAVKSNDCHKIRTLFSSGQASPFDIDDQQGQNLLQCAVANYSCNAYELLLDHELDPFMSDAQYFQGVWYSFVPFREYVGLVCPGDCDKNLRMFKQILSHPNAVLEADELIPSIISRCYHVMAASLILQAVTPNHDTLSHLLRARLAMLLPAPSPQAVRALLGPDLELSEAFTLLLASDSSVNHHDLWNRAVDWSQCVQDEEKQGWYTILSDIIAFESRYPHKFHYRSKLYRLILCTARHTKYDPKPFVYDWNHFFTQAARKWLRFIAELGGDLRQCGPSEKTALVGMSFDVHVSSTKRDGNRLIHKLRLEIRHVLYGSNIEDWHIFVVEVEACDASCIEGIALCRKHLYGRFEDAEYEMVGEFWNWTENPELFNMPGTYPPFPGRNPRPVEEPDPKPHTGLHSRWREGWIDKELIYRRAEYAAIPGVD